MRLSSKYTVLGKNRHPCVLLNIFRSNNFLRLIFDIVDHVLCDITKKDNIPFGGKVLDKFYRSLPSDKFYRSLKELPAYKSRGNV